MTWFVLLRFCLRNECVMIVSSNYPRRLQAVHPSIFLINWTHNKDQWLFGGNLWADHYVMFAQQWPQRETASEINLLQLQRESWKNPLELWLSMLLLLFNLLRGYITVVCLCQGTQHVLSGVGPLGADNRPLWYHTKRSWSRSSDNIWSRSSFMFYFLACLSPTGKDRW